MMVEAVLTVHGRVVALGEDDEAPKSGVAFRVHPDANLAADAEVLYVNGRPVGWLMGRFRVEAEDIFVAGSEAHVERLVTATEFPCILNFRSDL